MAQESLIQVGATEETLVALPCPSKLTVNLMDIDAETTTRSASGKMLRDRIAGGDTAKRKLELEWPASNGASVLTILQAIKDEFFYVRYPDPYTGNMRTARFYAGDRSVPMYSYNLYGRGILWEQVKVNLIEE